MKKSMRGEGAGMQEGETEGGIERERENRSANQKRGKGGERKEKQEAKARNKRGQGGRGEGQ